MLLLVLLISGCQKSTLAFIKSSELPYDANFNACSLVESVNNQKIPGLLNNGTEIVYENKTIQCNTNNVKIVPNEVLTIEYELQGRTYTKEIKFTQETTDDKKPSENEKLEGGTNATTPIPVEDSSDNEKIDNVPEHSIDSADDTNDEPPVKGPQSVNEGNNESLDKPTPQVPPVIVETVGVAKQFLVSESVTHVQAKAQCTAYINQYTNFTGCALIRDSATTLILGYETE